MARKKTTAQTYESGVLLIALGHAAYYDMAHNMAISIKTYSPDMPICLLVENESLVRNTDFFDQIKKIKPADMMHMDKVSPSRIKCRMSKYSPFQNTLYLDVDGVCINDLNPLMAALIESGKPYVTYVVDYGTKNKTEYDYNIWATNEDIWGHFGLGDEAVIPSLNSSFAFWNNSPEAQELMKKVIEFDINRLSYDKLTWTWGKRTSPRDIYPDELTYMAACASLEIDPKFEPAPILFSQKPVYDFAEVKRNYFVVAVYGDKTTTHKSVWDYYDRQVSKAHVLNGLPYQTTSAYIAQHKHANAK